MGAAALVGVMLIFAIGAYALVYLGAIPAPAWLASLDPHRCSARRCEGIKGPSGGSYDGTCVEIAMAMVADKASCDGALSAIRQCASCANCNFGDVCGSGSSPGTSPTRHDSPFLPPSSSSSQSPDLPGSA